MKNTKRNPLLALVVGIPLASVLFGAVMFYFALTSSDYSIEKQAEGAPLSKTSWRVDENP